jgi:hypothetical protein
MLEIADAPKRDITVQGLIMQAPMPYDEGHELTSLEAGVMNQTYLENLRNNYAAKIKKACEDSKVEKAGQLPPEVKASLQKDFMTYAEAYEFGVSGRTQVDPVRAQAVQIAIGCVKDALKEKNIKLSEIGADKIKEMAEQAVDTNPAFLEKAEAIVAAKRAAAQDIKVEL